MVDSSFLVSVICGLDVLVLLMIVVMFCLIVVGVLGIECMMGVVGNVV